MVTRILEIPWLCNKKRNVYPRDTVVMQQETSRVSWRYYRYVTRNARCILEIILLCNQKRHVYRPTSELLRYVTKQVILHTKPSTFYDSGELNQLKYLRQFSHSVF